MMTPRAIRRWSVVHSYSSLVCTAFMLMLCITGLPLIFHDEIEAALIESSFTPANPDGPLLDLDAMLAAALAQRPGEVPIFMSFDADRPVVNVTTGPSADAPGSQMHFASFDRSSGEPLPPHDHGIMDVLLQIHTDMYLGSLGMWFLGAMGLLFVVAVVSGVVLYAPFMRKLPFGALRLDRSPRIRWLDWHNLLGVVTVAWVLVVALTGVIHTLASPIIDVWKEQQLADLMAEQDAPAEAGQWASLEQAVAEAKAAAPDMTLQFVAFPGGSYSTDHHYAVYLHGDTPLTAHLTTPALIDARNGELVGLREMPWYMKALSLSQPLHFGDYGGLPLKLLWAVLTLATILVLVSGLLLWVRRRKAAAAPAALRLEVLPGEAV